MYLQPSKVLEYQDDHNIKVVGWPNVDQISPCTLAKLGGAGNKANKVTLGEADCYVTDGLGFWDFCAPEALIKGMGGVVTSLNQRNRLSYDEKKYNYLPPCVATNSIGIYNLIMSRRDK